MKPKCIYLTKTGPSETISLKRETTMKMYHDQEKPGISRQSNWFFFSEANHLTVAVFPRQVKSGVLRARSIRD